MKRISMRTPWLLFTQSSRQLGPELKRLPDERCCLKNYCTTKYDVNLENRSVLPIAQTLSFKVKYLVVLIQQVGFVGLGTNPPN